MKKEEHYKLKKLLKKSKPYIKIDWKNYEIWLYGNLRIPILST